jgi:hypothetical protein
VNQKYWLNFVNTDLRIETIFFNLPVQSKEAYGEVRTQLHSFVNSTLDVGELSGSRPGRFTIEYAVGNNKLGTVKSQVGLTSYSTSVAAVGRGGDWEVLAIPSLGFKDTAGGQFHRSVAICTPYMFFFLLFGIGG